MKNIILLLAIAFTTFLKANSQCIVPTGRSPLEITVNNGIAFGCFNGSILIKDTSASCTTMVAVYRMDNGFIIDSFNISSVNFKTRFYNSLYQGDYIFHSLVILPDASIFYEHYDTVSVGPLCQISATASTVAASAAGCRDGKVVVKVLSNACNKYIISILDKDSVLIDVYFGLPTDLIVFDGLLPDNYIVLAKLNSASGNSAGCEQYLNVTVGSPVCASTFSYNVTHASNFSCTDGRIELTDANPSCDYFFTMYYADATNGFLAGFSSGNSGSYSGINSTYDFKNLIPGTYYFKTDKPNCIAFDTIKINPKCELSSTITSLKKTKSGCGNGSVTLNTQFNTCLGYRIAIQNASNGSFIYTNNSPFTDSLFTLNNLKNGNYIATITGAANFFHFRNTYPAAGFFPTVQLTIDSGICSLVVNFTITSEPCVSGIKKSTINPLGFGCNSGSITLEDTLSCFARIDAYYGSNLDFVGDLSLVSNGVRTFNNLQSGRYVLTVSRFAQDVDGNFLECIVNDTVVLEPENCAMQGVVDVVNESRRACQNGEIKIHLNNTNACQFFQAKLFQASNSQLVEFVQDVPISDTIVFDNLIPGNYLVQFYIQNGFNQMSSCNELVPVTIGQGSCPSNSGLLISSVDAACYDVIFGSGSITITDTSTCNSTISVIKLNPSPQTVFQINSASLGNNTQTINNLLPDTYVVRTLRTGVDLDFNTFNCGSADTVVIKPECLITANTQVDHTKLSCNNGKITATVRTTSCGTYNATLRISGSFSVVAQQVALNPADSVIVFNNLPTGDYELIIDAISQFGSFMCSKTINASVGHSCYSPITLSQQNPVSSTCNDGSITITDTSTLCSVKVEVFKNDTFSFPILTYFSSNPLFKTRVLNSLTPGTYFIRYTITETNPNTIAKVCKQSLSVVLSGTSVLWYLDADNDGYYIASQFSCESPGTGWKRNLPSGGSGDCNDNNAAINPGAADNNCNGIDDNCSGTVDEHFIPANCIFCSGGNLVSTAATWYLDADNDGYYIATQNSCESPGIGWTITQPINGAGDCDDYNVDVNPFAPELCDGLDNNCDGDVDEGCQSSILIETGSSNSTCFDLADGTALVSASGSTGNFEYLWSNGATTATNSDLLPGVYAFTVTAFDNANNVVETTSGTVEVDANVGATYWYADADGDGFGNHAINVLACIEPAGYVANNNDCNDSKATVYPGAPELCDGLDNDCDGAVDEGFQLKKRYPDADGDGKGDANHPGANVCKDAPGWANKNDDCDDANPTVYKGAPEYCDGLDNNCNGKIDDKVKYADYYLDADADGQGGKGNPKTRSCIPLFGYVTNNNDCNDANPNVYKGALEICGNRIDDNCNGKVDEKCPNTTSAKTDETDIADNDIEYKIEDDIDVLKSIKVYPNPFTNQCNIQFQGFENTMLKVTVCNALGQVVIERNKHIENGISDDVLYFGNLPTGFYNIHVSSPEINRTYKVMKRY